MELIPGDSSESIAAKTQLIGMIRRLNLPLNSIIHRKLYIHGKIESQRNYRSLAIKIPSKCDRSRIKPISISNRCGSCASLRLFTGNWKFFSSSNEKTSPEETVNGATQSKETDIIHDDYDDDDDDTPEDMYTPENIFFAIKAFITSVLVTGGIAGSIVLLSMWITGESSIPGLVRRFNSLMRSGEESDINLSDEEKEELEKFLEFFAIENEEKEDKA